MMIFQYYFSFSCFISMSNNFGAPNSPSCPTGTPSHDCDSNKTTQCGRERSQARIHNLDCASLYPGQVGSMSPYFLDARFAMFTQFISPSLLNSCLPCLLNSCYHAYSIHFAMFQCLHPSMFMSSISLPKKEASPEKEEMQFAEFNWENPTKMTQQFH